ncbi:uncharacterized protein LOC108950821 [Ciona intestinalis]
MSDEKQQEPFKLNIKTPGSRAMTSRMPTIEDIFGSDGGRLLQEQKGIKFDPAVIESKHLVDHYRCCMLAGETEEAIRIKEQLKILLEEKFQTTPNEIKTFAHTIRGEGRGMEAILFYQIAAEFYGNQSKAGLVGIKNCAGGIKNSIKTLVSRDEELKPIIRTHVIPLMRDMREMIRRSDDVSEEVYCLHYIEFCQYLVGDFNSSETTCKKAIDIMESVFKESAGKYKVYGLCLNNLGYTYMNTSRPNDACEYYRKAIAAYEKAEDINDDKRAKEIDRSKGNLEQVRKELQSSVSQATSSLQGMQINPQDQQQPAQPNTQIGNVTGSTIFAGSPVTGSAVASSGINLQRNISSNRTTNVTGSTIVSGVNQTNSSLLSSRINQQQNPDVNQQQNSDVNQQQNPDVNQQQNSDVNQQQNSDVNQQQNSDVNQQQNSDVNQQQNSDVNQQQNSDVNQQQNSDINQQQNSDVNQQQNSDVNQQQNSDVNQQQHRSALKKLFLQLRQMIVAFCFSTLGRLLLVLIFCYVWLSYFPHPFNILRPMG